MRRTLIYIIFLSLISLPLSSQDIKVRAWFDTTTIYIGDHVNFNLDIEVPQGKHISYPVIADTLADGLEIISSTEPDTTFIDNNYYRLRASYLLTAFDTGYYEVEPIEVSDLDSKPEKKYFSDYNYLEVVRVNISPADSTAVIFDIVGPRKAPLTFMEVFPWVLLMALVVLLLLFFIRFFRKKGDGKADEEISFMPSEPIHIVALRDLDKLEKKELWQKFKHKEYYSELTCILRIYLDRRYSISSMEMTTRETLEALGGSGFDDDELYSLLSGILTVADMSKFAKYMPDNQYNIKVIDDARQFIKKTSRKALTNPDGTENENGKEDTDE